MFTAALFTIARTRGQARCPPTEEWIRKVWCTHTQTHTHTHRHTHTQTYTHRHTQSIAQPLERIRLCGVHTHTHTDTHRHRNTHTQAHTEYCSAIRKNKAMWCTHTQIHKQTNTNTYTHRDTQTHTGTHTEYCSAIRKNKTICSKMGGPKGYHTKWRKPEKDKYISLICGI